MLFVTIVVIHIYSDCALGPAKNGVRQCHTQTSSCRPKGFTNWGNPMDAEGEGGMAGGCWGAEPTARDATASRGCLFLGQWS